MTDREKYFRQIIDKLRLIDYIKPEDIPNISLYMDQVTTFMDEHLQSLKRYEDDKMLTKTMINNYTKNNLLPSPDKKKYSKDHMLLLIFIYYFKNMLSISDIQSILGPLTEKFFKNDEVSLQYVYETIFSIENEQASMLAKDILKKYTKSREIFADCNGSDEDKEFLDNFSFICMLAFDIYIKKTIIEKMIDTGIMGDKKNKSKDTDSKAAKSKDKPEKGV